MLPIGLAVHEIVQDIDAARYEAEQEKGDNDIGYLNMLSGSEREDDRREDEHIFAPLLRPELLEHKLESI
jgi:hypothetical protein